MSTPEIKVIIPVMAIRHMKPVGGIPMLQAAPDDYFLAASIASYLQNHDWDELEFALKVYLPIAAIYSKESEQYFSLEPLGLRAIGMKLLSSDVTPSSFPKVSMASLSDALDSLEEINDWMSGKPILEEESVAGMVEKGTTHTLMLMSEWPERSTEEAFSIRLPSPLDAKALISAARNLSNRIQELHKLQNLTYRLQMDLQKSIDNIIDNASNEVQNRKERLGRRLRVLEGELENLSTKLAALKSKGHFNREQLRDIEQTIEKRKGAYQRDLNRKENVEKTIEKQISQLQKMQETLDGRLEKLNAALREAIQQISEYSVDFQSDIADGRLILILLPFILFGDTSKSRLRISLQPPARLVEPENQVGLRRDFVDPFTSLNEDITHFVEQLGERIDSDVSIRRSIVNHAEKHNLLAIRETRQNILNGSKLLSADGLLKDSVIEEIDQLLDSVPIIEDAAIGHPRSIPYRSKEVHTAKVRFQVRSDSGRAISDAIIQLGGFKLKTDEKGMSSIDLPRSRYEGTVDADGFMQRKFEFSLNSTEDLAIPIILESLPYEELISQSLDKLLKRTERLESIQSRLNKAFEKHGNKLVSIPIYRSALTELLTELGHDPESWIARAKEESQMVGRLLDKRGRDDAIRRDILKIAQQSRDSGGILLLSDLLTKLHQKGWEIETEKLDSILEDMAEEGVIEGKTTLEGGSRLVKFIPVSLTSDPRKILSLASRFNGKLSIENILVELGWTEERARNALDLLVAKGIAKVQKSYAKSTTYWFPSLITRKE